MAEKIMLLDGHSLLNRAFYGLPNLTNSKGQHTNAVLGFCNMMLRYIEEEQPTHLLVAFDRKEPTFRHIQYKEYKGTRKGMPEEIHEQVGLMKELLQAMEIPVVTQVGIEADDILGTVACQAQEKGLLATIVSGDRDLLQLATEQIKIKIPKTKGGGTVTEEYFAKDVEALYGVTPTEFIDMKGLMGDPSDNIPGVPNIGKKTAEKMIKEFHTIENAYANIDAVKPPKARNNLKEFYDQAIMSKELATIKTDCELAYDLSEARLGELFTKEAYVTCKNLELKSLYKYFESQKKEEVSLDILCTSDLSYVESFKQKLLEEAEREVQNIGFSYIGAGEYLRGISITTKKETTVILAQGFLTADYLKDYVVDLLESGIKLCVLDSKACLHVDGRLSTYMGQIQDIGLQAYLLSPLQATYDYEDIARAYLDMTLPSRKEVCGKKAIEDIPDLTEEAYQNLVAYLSYVPYQACEAVEKELDEAGMKALYEEIELPTVVTLYAMEKYGITVKKEELKLYGEQLTGRIKELETRIYELAGKEFNINSPKQLGPILFEDLGMPFGKKTKTGYATGAEVLEKLKAEGYEIADQLLEYRQLTKLKSTYAEGLYTYIEGDGKIHSIFHQKVTATGRLSSSDPNLQNIPIRMPLGRAIRKVFVPEEGYRFISADYSQIELRVLAHMSGDQNLIEAYQQQKDIHTSTASKVFGVPLDEVTPLLRRNAKAVNFGIVYGISSFGLSEDLGISRKEAKEYIDKYFETYPDLKRYLDENVAFAKEHGYVTTLYGRIRPIPELKSSNFMQRSFGERAAMNSSIQGTAADIIKLAMIRVSERIKKEKLGSRLILQIHDELLIETRLGEEEIVRRILTEEMMGAADLSVPLEIGISEGDNWFEAK